MFNRASYPIMPRRHFIHTKVYTARQVAAKKRDTIMEYYRLKDENEALKGDLMLSEACKKHYKWDRDVFRRKYTEIKDLEVKEDSNVLTSFSSMKTNVFEPTCGILRSSFKRSEIYDRKKTIITNQRMQQRENEIKKRDTQVKELEDVLQNQKIENKNLQAVINDRESELVKVREKLKLVLEEIKENEDTLNEMRTERIQQDVYIKELRQKLEDKRNMLETIQKECNERVRTQSKIIQQLRAKLERGRFKPKDQENVSLNQVSIAKENNEEKLDARKREQQVRDQLQLALKKQKETENELEEVKRLKDIEQTSKEDLEKKVRKYENDPKQIESIYKETITPQNLAIQKLELEIKHRDQEVKSLKKTLESKTDEARDCKLLRLRLEETESKLSAHMNEHLQNLQRLKQTLANLDEMKIERDSSRLTNQNLQKKIHELEKEIEQLHHLANHQKEVLKMSKLEDIEKNETQEELKKSEFKITSLNDQLQKTRKILTETESELRETKTRHTDLQKQVQRLEKEIDQLNFMNRKEAVSKTSKMKDSERFELEGELRKREIQITTLNDKLQQANKKLTETESDLREMKTRRTDQNLQKQVHRLEKEIEQLCLKANRQEAVSKTSKKEDSERIEMEEELKKREVEITRLMDQLQQEKVKLTKTESELQETKTRLSKAMGDKLTDNNPNIADLSDKNRPVKLAERFGELYDNQWTDAYDVIEKYFGTEERTLGELLNILQEISCFCKTSWAKQMEDLLKILWFSANTEDVPPEVNKILKDCKKTTASVAMRNLYDMYIARLQHSGDETSRIALEIQPFVKECLEICWLMMIQDPPVVFAPTAERGSKLNTDIFKPYTKSGTHVEYTVWPAMLLHEKGPVLAKGVAQGYKQE